MVLHTLRSARLRDSGSPWMRTERVTHETMTGPDGPWCCGPSSTWSAPTSTTRDPGVTLVDREGARDRGRPVGSTRQEPERARRGKGHAAAGGCVFRRNMGLFPFATRFARASQLAFVASPPTNGLTPRSATLDHACLFLPALSSFRTIVLASHSIPNN